MEAQLIEHLKSLHTGAIDARNGYQEALRDAEGHGITDVFRRMIQTHTTNAEELAALLARAGEAPDDSGSFMTTIHRAIMSIRAIFDGLDESVLPGLIDGETRNVSHYEDTLDLSGIVPSIRNLLADQRDRLRIAIAAMRALNERSGISRSA